MKALIYTKDYCVYCTKAKAKLQELGIEFTEVDVSDDHDKQNELVRITGQFTLPQIFLHIGGADDLFEAADSGKLDKFLG